MKNLLRFQDFINESSVDDGFQFWQSIFKPDVNIFMVFEGYPGYEGLIPIFDKYGYGFYSPNQNMIIIDGEMFIGDDGLTTEDLKFVEAHEISHLLLDHNGPRNQQDELEADIGAYVLLKRHNLPTDRLVSEFMDRHGVEFTEDLLDIVSDRL